MGCMIRENPGLRGRYVETPWSFVHCMASLQLLLL